MLISSRRYWQHFAVHTSISTVYTAVSARMKSSSPNTPAGRCPWGFSAAVWPASTAFLVAGLQKATTT